MKLAYKATTPDGKILQGVIEAKTIEEAAAYLRSKEMLPIRVFEKKDTNILASIPFIPKGRGDIVMFTRQLSSMVSSGLTLIQGLRILEGQTNNEQLKAVIGNVISEVEDGVEFSDAIAKHPEYFDPVYVALMRAAEKSGLLDKILARLADNLEKERQLKATIKGALMYPIIIVVGMVGVMVIMVTFVIPQLQPLYAGLNTQLPVATEVLLGISGFIQTLWPLLLGGVLLCIFLFRRWYKTETGKLLTDTLMLKIPIFGGLMQESLLTEITRIFGLLSSAGILVVDGLQQTADISSNILYKIALKNVAQSVEKGVSIGESMSFSDRFPPIVIEMVKVGEQTGKLDDALLRLSSYYEQEVDQKVQSLTTLLEPIILVFLGAGVAFLMFAVISPIYSILNSFQ